MLYAFQPLLYCNYAGIIDTSLPVSTSVWFQQARFLRMWRVKFAVWSLSKALLERGVLIFPHIFSHYAQSRVQSSTHNTSSNVELQGEVSNKQEPWTQELTCFEMIPYSEFFDWL